MRRPGPGPVLRGVRLARGLALRAASPSPSTIHRFPRPVSFVADVGLPRFPRSKWPSTLKQIYYREDRAHHKTHEGDRAARAERRRRDVARRRLREHLVERPHHNLRG